MILAIAVMIIVLISFASIKFRCYACFNLVLMGLSIFLAGLIRKESLFTVGGGAFLIAGLLIMFATSLQVERSRRMIYMLRLFLCGMFYFLHVMMIMLIITIPLAGIVKALATDYQERILVDVNGSRIGTVYVDKNNKGADGRKYEHYDPY